MLLIMRKFGFYLLKMILNRSSRYIFSFNEPEFGWNARERALTASTELRQHIKEQISRDRNESSGSVR